MGDGMNLWKKERSFVHYRVFHESIIDKLDLLYRLLTRQNDLPPYSLRNLAGGAKSFRNVGPWFLKEFERLGLYREECRILDVGCGCGRIAYTLSMNPDLRKLNVQYVGVDIDRKAILWCCKHITPKNNRFQFYHADLHNRSYNPQGKYLAKTFRFPHRDRSFDLIILTSVFTHLLEEELRNYLRELFRLMEPDGTIYASFFTYRSREEATKGAGRHPINFPCYHGHFAVHSDTYPEKAVAYKESFLLELVESTGFQLASHIMYGIQDVLVLTKQSG